VPENHSPAAAMGADQFCQMLGRQVDFDRIEADTAGKYPVLLIGARFRHAATSLGPISMARPRPSSGTARS